MNEPMLGTIAGTVTASESGRPLARAQVSVQGTVRRAVPDVVGRYRLTCEQGTYTVQAATLGRQPDRRQVSVAVGGTSTANFSVALEGIEADTQADAESVAPGSAAPEHDGANG